MTQTPPQAGTFLRHSAHSILVASLILVGSIAHRADALPISWAVDADGSWDTATNWSSNPTLPGSSDDVTIDRPAGVYAVTHSTANTTINSLQSNENLILDGAKSLTVRGPSVLNGELDIRAGSTIYADGPSASLVANGATTLDGAHVRAKNGATISLPFATTYTDATNPSFGRRVLRATGAGSILNMSAITTATSGSGGFSHLGISAIDGGFVDFSGLTSFSTVEARFVAQGASSVVDISSLSSFTPQYLFVGDRSRIEATTGGTLVMPNLTNVTNTDLYLDGTGTADTSQISTFVANTARISGGAPDFSGMTNIDASSFFASGGATISIPNTTTYADLGNPSWGLRTFEANGVGSSVDLSPLTNLISSAGAFSGLTMRAKNGGRVDVSNIPSFTVGTGHIDSDGTGSVVDLSSMTAFTPGNVFGEFSTVKATDGGTILFSPGATGINRADVKLSQGGTIVGGTINLLSGASLKGDGTIAANLVNQTDITLGLGGDAVELSVLGDFTQVASGDLFVELGGILPGEFDLLSITGAAMLDGTLDVSLLSGFVPIPNDSFTFLTADGGVSGMFDTENLPTLGGTLEWQVVYGTHNVSLLAFDTAVPEPSTIAMAAMGLLGLACYGWRRRRGRRKTDGASVNAFSNPSLDRHLRIQRRKLVMSNKVESQRTLPVNFARRVKFLTAFIALAAALITGAPANALTLTQIDRGWFEDTGRHEDFGKNSFTGATGGQLYRSFF